MFDQTFDVVRNSFRAHAVLALVLALLAPGILQAGVFYVDGAAANDTGDGSQGRPKKYLSSGGALMSANGGDVLIVAPGTYATSNDNISSVRPGKSGAYNVVRAAVDGSVVIKTGLDLGSGAHYLQFEGLKWDDTNGKTITGSFFKCLRCAFKGGPSAGNSVSVQIGTNDFTPGADHILLEDSWVYGYGGRYKILVYNAQNIVLRRIVTRFDGFDPTNIAPEADIALYDSKNVAVLNPIAIDGITGSAASDYVAAFYNVGNNTTSTPNSGKEWRGCMAVNPTGYLMGTEGSGSESGLTVTDCAAFGSTYGISQLHGNNQYTRVTLVSPRQDGFGIYGGSATIKDSVVVASGGEAFNGVSPQNSTSYSAVSAAVSAGLKYLPRIEPGSALASGGGSGGQRGANITKRIGTSGTLYGDPGYNVETSQDLWPWPHENRIKQDFAEYSTRGFAGSNLSLTDYIWSKLGSTSPVAGAPEPLPPSQVIVQ